MCLNTTFTFWQLKQVGFFRCRHTASKAGSMQKFKLLNFLLVMYFYWRSFVILWMFVTISRLVYTTSLDSALNGACLSYSTWCPFWHRSRARRRFDAITNPTFLSTRYQHSCRKSYNRWIAPSLLIMPFIATTIKSEVLDFASMKELK